MVDEARRWVEQGPSWGDAALAPLTAVTQRAVGAIARVPAVADAIERGATTLVDEVLGDVEQQAATSAASTSTPTTASGRLAVLDDADEQTEQVRERAKGRLAARGAVTGALSVNTMGAVAALATDVVTMTATQLRAVGRILALHGVEELGTTAVATLVLAGETEVGRRREGLLLAAGFDARGDGLAGDLEEVVAEQIGARVATDAVEQLLRRRVQQRAVGLVPVVGAAAGAVTAAWMTARACDTARHVGRLRFLRVHAALDRSTIVR
jgi:hypothetical protein